MTLGHFTRFLCLLAVCSLSTGRCAVSVGSGPTFNYSYSPRLALGLDTNALNVDVSYVREPPTQFNCSYIVPASSATPASGTVTYQFFPDSGYVIQDLVLFQKTTLYTTGGVTGEYSTDGGMTFQTFYGTPPYLGSTRNFTKQIRLHYVNATNLIVRYTILRTGSSRSVQFLRDCDDATTAFSASGTIVTEAQARATRGVAIVNQGSTWKYLDNGSNQSDAWRQLSFDDTSWPSGPAEFGYGDGDELTTNQFGADTANKYVTTYYRHQFVNTNQTPFRRVMVGLLRDDGGLVHLNGAEVFRSNMRTGTIDFMTLALSSVDQINETIFYETNVPPATLHVGTNILAVEIHQQRRDSSDISFDLDLWGELEAERPRLQASRNEDCLLLSWSAEDFILESAATVTGPWDPVPGTPTSPYSVCGLEQAGFFRLKQKP
jgi:hypothetical protein